MKNKMNKSKILLATLIPASALSTIAAATTALVGCSCGNKIDGNVVIETGVTGISVKSSKIQQGKESTFELTIPANKKLADITLSIGDSVLQGKDIKIDGTKITIPADKMIDNKVVIKSVTLEDKETSSTKAEWVAKVKSAIEAEIVKDKNTEYTNSQVEIYLDDAEKPAKFGNLDFKLYGSQSEKEYQGTRYCWINDLVGTERDVYILDKWYEEVIDELPDEKTTGVTYRYDDNGYYFTHPSQTEGYTILSFNKYGYLLEEKYVDNENPDSNYHNKIVYKSDAIKPDKKRIYLEIPNNVISLAKPTADIEIGYLREEENKTFTAIVSAGDMQEAAVTGKVKVTDSQGDTVAESDTISVNKGETKYANITINWEDATNYDTWKVQFEEDTGKKTVTINVNKDGLPKGVDFQEMPESLEEGESVLFGMMTTDNSVYHVTANLKTSDGTVISSAEDFIANDNYTTFNIEISDEQWEKIQNKDILTVSFECTMIKSIEINGMIPSTFYVGDILDTTTWTINAISQYGNQWTVDGPFSTNWDDKKFTTEHVGKQSVTVTWHGITYTTASDEKINVSHKTSSNVTCTSHPEELLVTPDATISSEFEFTVTLQNDSTEEVQKGEVYLYVLDEESNEIQICVPKTYTVDVGEQTPYKWSPNDIDWSLFKNGQAIYVGIHQK